ncbi:MAG: SCP2 sterol-binding domain-containing protein [Anaerolineales bacterium]|nr:SCP2 sterol-binding domain-containing protein [Anaerolineales bacterium]
MSVAEIFKSMPSNFNAEKAGDLNANVVFDLSGEGGGAWTVGVANGKVDVNEGAAANPTATIRMSAQDYEDMTSGKLNPMMAFMSGKIKVEGDLNTVMKFQTLFGM